MFRVITKQIIAEKIKRIEFDAPLIAPKVKPGHFCMVTPDERSERIPLSIIEADAEKGSITVVTEEVNASTSSLGSLKIDEEALSIMGPLGEPAQIKNFGAVACIGYGAYIAQLLPICRAFKKAGNKTIGIIGAKTKRSLPLESQMRLACSKLFITTDDGSYGQRGSVIGVLDKVLEKEKIDLVYVVAHTKMMEMITHITRPKKIKTRVRLNPPIIDGIGICASSKVRVSQKSHDVCLEGPDFDGHSVDFRDLEMRLRCRQLHIERFKKLHKKQLSSRFQDFLSSIINEQRDEGLKKSRKEKKNYKTIKKFSKEPSGFSKKLATEEARRFPQPYSPEKVPGCPIGIDILGFVRRLRESDITGTLERIREQNSLAGICGRVCSAPCEKEGALGIEKAVKNIRMLERFASDQGRKKLTSKKSKKRTGEKIAIVGSGPSGLTAAAELAKKNYHVTIFEAMHLPGGVLRYGIPEFRLPKKVLEEEIDYICSLGVKIHTDVFIGQTYSVNDIFDKGFVAVLIAAGAGVSQPSGIAGERFGGVYFAQELLMRVNLMEAHKFPKSNAASMLTGDVCVIGSDSAAFDCARIALRLGKKTTLICQGTEDDMGVLDEIRNKAREEGLKIDVLTKPVEISADGEHCVKGVKCIRMDYADPDSNGNWKVIPVKGTEFTVDATTVIISNGSKANIYLGKVTPGVRTLKNSTIWTRKESATTSVDGIFACGDVVSGQSCIIDAMVSGKKAAGAIDIYIHDKAR